VRNVEVAERVQVAEKLTGDQLLKGASGGVDAFAQLTQLRDALAVNDVATVLATIDPLQNATEQVARSRMTVGFRLNRLETHRSKLKETTFQTRQLLSNSEDLDYTTAILELVLRQNTMDVARNALARILGGTNVMSLIG
jgi:flagellin-like hook-associated protein FlgL